MDTKYDVVFDLKEIKEIKEDIKRGDVTQRSIPITSLYPKCNEKFRDALVILEHERSKTK